MENEFDSDDTEPFPFDGEPLVTTPSPAATSKEEDELQSAEEEFSKFSRSSHALFEFSDDESQPLVQVNNLIKLSEQTSRFEEASRKLTKAMKENTACMNRLLDREEASTSRETNNGKPEQKRSTPGRCVDCGKISKKREAQRFSSMKIGQIKITISFEIEECEGRRKPAANNSFRPTIDAWLERWKSDDKKQNSESSRVWWWVHRWSIKCHVAFIMRGYAIKECIGKLLVLEVFLSRHNTLILPIYEGVRGPASYCIIRILSINCNV